MKFVLAGTLSVLAVFAGSKDFYIDSESTASIADGSPASPFSTLAEALSAAVPFSQAKVHLISPSPQRFPACSVDTNVEIVGNGSAVLLYGPIYLNANVSFSTVALESGQITELSLLKVGGLLVIRECRVSGITTLFAAVEGGVCIDSSVFEGNLHGLLHISRLGSRVEMTNSLFTDNSGAMGTVINLTPAASIAAPTLIAVTSCQFVANEGSNGSVLYVGDGSGSGTARLQLLHFSNCTFWRHTSPLFVLSMKSFELVVESCTFVNVTGVVEGSVDGTRIVFSLCSVTDSSGPLFRVSLAGELTITDSVFQRVKVNVLDVSGTNTDVSKSVVILSKLEMRDFENFGEVVLGVILNSIHSTVWLADVSLRTFACSSIGAFSTTSSVLFARRLYLAHGTADSNVFGLFLSSSLDFADLVVETIGSLAATTSFTWCFLSFRNVTYLRIVGVYQPNISANTTNLMFIRTASAAELDGIYADMKVQGTVLFYVSEGAVATLKNSVITGVVGRGFSTVQQGSFYVRNCTIDVVKAGSFLRLMQGGLFDIDFLRFAGTVFEGQIFTISSRSVEKIGVLELVNVTSITISKGQDFRIEIGSLLATSVRSNALFDISVNMYQLCRNLTIAGLRMKDCLGDLVHVIGSSVELLNADVTQVMPNFNFIYADGSRLLFSNFSLENMSFSENGGLMTVIDNSEIQLLNTSFRNILSSEQGVMLIHNSRIDAKGMKIENFNARFIDSDSGNVTFADLIIRNEPKMQNGKNSSFLPNGGFLACKDCPEIQLTEVAASGIYAKAGGVLYLYGNKGGRLEIGNSTFSNCFALTAGGVARVTQYSVSISETRFIDNSAESGGVISTEALTKGLHISRCAFQGNSARTDGSCIQWRGIQPAVVDSVFANNSAVYGNPLASTPRFWHLIDPTTKAPAEQQLTGVAGQEMKEPFVLGEFDALGQLISTDNSSVVYLQTERFLNLSGNIELVATQGLANFSVVFSTFFVGVVNVTISGGSAEVIPYTFQYSLRDCKSGEVRTPSGCFPCPKNSYSLSPDDFACSLCVPYAECKGLNSLVLDPQYWRKSNQTDQIYKCISREACTGGSDAYCRKGYEDVLCGACSKGFYKWAVWNCCDCNDGIPTAARAFLIVALVFLAVLVPMKLVGSGEEHQRHCIMAYRLVLEFSQSFAFFQLIHAQWPLPMLIFFEAVRTVGSFGSVFVSFDCTPTELSPFHLSQIAKALYPLLFLTASAALFLTTRLRRPVRTSHMCLSLLAATYHYLPMALLAGVSSLQCVSVEGRLWLVADTHEECFSQSHWVQVCTITIPLLVLSAFACVFAAMILRGRCTSALCERLHLYLKADYCEGKWELLTMLRWWCFAALVPFFARLDAISQSLVYSALLGLDINRLYRAFPHKSYWLNIAHLSSLSFQYVFLMATLSSQDHLALIISAIITGIEVFCGYLIWRNRNAYREEVSLSATANVERHSIEQFSVDNLKEIDYNPPPPSLLYQSSVM